MPGQTDPAEPPDTDSVHQAFDRITDAVFALDDEFRFTYLNERAAELLEADAGSLLGERLWEGYPEVEGTALDDAVHEAYETQRSIETEARLASLDIWADARIYPSESGLSVYLRDVTDQKACEHELDCRRALLEAQTETTIDGHLVVDRDRNILYYNDRFTEIWDIPEEVIEQRSDERALEYVVDSVVDSEDFLEKVEYLYENPYEESRDEIRHTDGRWFDRYSAPVVDENGTHYGRLWIFRDITERKERERQLSTLMDSVPGMVYRCRNERGWPMEFVSDGARELTGYEPDALERDDRSYGGDVVHENDAETVWQSVQDGLRDDGSYLLTYRVTTADGDVRWVQERGRQVVNGNAPAENAELLEGVVIDVTERKRLEAELDEIFGRVTDAFYALDEEFRFTHVNDRAAELLQASEEELLGESLWETFPDAADNDTVWDAFHTAMDAQEPQGYELYFDPLEFWVEATVYPSETGVSVYFRDVTDRKEHERALEKSERRYRTLIENFPNGAVGLFDEALTYTVLGGRLLEDVGVSAEGRVGDRIEDIYPSDAYEEIEPYFEAALEGEVNEFEIELYDRHLNAQTLPVTNADDELFAGMVVFQDVTERKTYRRKLEESNEQLEQFAHAVSHDLQEPLRMVSSYLRLLDQRHSDELDEEAEEFLEFAVDGADRMKAMIDGLLEYSRVETRGDPFTPVDLDGVVEDVLKDLQFQIEEQNAEITVESLPTVNGDVSQLRQVFQNLLDNAIEYSGDAPPHVVVSAERDGDEWVVSVADDGIGIDPGDRDRIFGVFQRLHSREERPGTGIGLTLCERIVDRHGGDIWVDSEPGDGATFSFTLPAADDREN